MARVGRGWAAAAVLAGWALGAAPAAERRPSWECLPADTALMVRLPQAAEFIEAMRTSTRFGAVALRADRLDGLWRMLVEQADEVEAVVGDTVLLSAPDEWEQMLGKYGLESADLAAAFGGDLGIGLVVRPREGNLPPLMMLLAWAEPGEEVAGRVMAAVKQRLEERAAEQADGPAVRRFDLDLAGQEVVSAVIPVMSLELDEDEDASPTDDADPDAVDPVDERADLAERMRRAKRVQTGEGHLFITSRGGRVLYGITLPAQAADAADASPDLETLGGGELAREIFGGFLAAHDRDDEPPLARVLREPALAAARVAGVPLVEALFVPRVLTSRDPEADSAAGLGLAGLDDLGGIAWRQAFADGCWRSTIAVTLPAPRHGLLGMLDQRCDPCDVPPFVTREVVDFTQISLDLGAAFRTIRGVFEGDAAAEQLTNLLNVADVQATTWLGVDVATALSGLGSRHWILSFPPRIAAAVAEARAAGQGGEASSAMPATDRLAVVWEVADEAPLVKLLGQVAPLVGADVKEEQGFRGLRLPGEIAASIGRGHLVVAVGEGTLEKVLTAIRNPPAGDVSWRESDALRRARGLLDLAPARMFAVGDAAATGGMLGALREFVAALEPGDVEEGSRELLAAGQKLLPTAAEMQGMFGVSASVLRLTDDGLVLESAWELPAP